VGAAAVVGGVRSGCLGSRSRGFDSRVAGARRRWGEEVGAIRELDGDGGGKDARKSQQVLEAGEEEEEVGGICSAIHECE
jgi:hypothetical protein